MELVKTYAHALPNMQQDAGARGVIVNASTQFVIGEQHPRAVRICLGPPRTRASLEQALR
jgi:hypothetical protein